MPTRGAQSRLGQQPGPHVVPDDRGQVEVGLDLGADVEVTPAEVGRVEPDTSRLVDEPRHDHPAPHQVHCVLGRHGSQQRLHGRGDSAADVGSDVRGRRCRRLGEDAVGPVHEGGLDPGAPDVDGGDHLGGHRRCGRDVGSSHGRIRPWSGLRDRGVEDDRAGEVARVVGVQALLARLEQAQAVDPDELGERVDGPSTRSARRWRRPAPATPRAPRRGPTRRGRGRRC